MLRSVDRLCRAASATKRCAIYAYVDGDRNYGRQFLNYGSVGDVLGRAHWRTPSGCVADTLPFATTPAL